MQTYVDLQDTEEIYEIELSITSKKNKKVMYRSYVDLCRRRRTRKLYIEAQSKLVLKKMNYLLIISHIENNEV